MSTVQALRFHTTDGRKLSLHLGTRVLAIEENPGGGATIDVELVLFRDRSADRRRYSLKESTEEIEQILEARAVMMEERIKADAQAARGRFHRHPRVRDEVEVEAAGEVNVVLDRMTLDGGRYDYLG